MLRKKALFFCSSYFEIDPKYNQAARDAVRAACLSGYDIVSGGIIKGTMDVVCKAAAECGAGVNGVLPRFMKGLENPLLTSLEWCDTMSERKELMRKGTSVAIALPGGIGTLDELSETLCLAKMDIYKGRVMALNIDGFFDAYKMQLEKCVKEKMLPSEFMEKVSFPTSVDELKKLL